MSYLYSADDFDINGNFVPTGHFQDLLTKDEGLTGHIPLFDEVNWDDPVLYTMSLTSDEIAAIISNTPGTELPHLPAPPSVANSSPHLPTPPPVANSFPNPPSRQLPETRSPSPERSALLREANSSSWAA
ncbi:hypothetical protein BDR03DRAFT_1017440 [Suillus americanus]|nr:hypothetical protein BDR03DRAFT_1017440 [Suillus americanus]